MANVPLIAGAAAAAPVAWREGRALGADQYLADVARLAGMLPSRAHVLNGCADRYRFAVGLGAALSRGQVTLLPPDHAAQTVRQLLGFAADAYLLADEGSAAIDLPRVDVPVDAARAARGALVPAFAEEQLCAIVFTSGSTGTPVGNPKHWGILARNVRGALARWGLAPARAAILGTVPPQHMYGFESTVLAPLQGGGALCAERPFHADEICAQLERLPRPRVLVSTPFHLRTLLGEVRRPPAADLLLCATAPLDAALAALAEARFGCGLLEIYGSTETGQMATRRTALDQAWLTLPGIRIESRGERTWASGGHIEQATALGDVVEPLAADRFLLRGRVSDMINVAGKRSSLAHLDAQLRSIEGVLDSAFYMPEDDAARGVTRLAAFVVAPGMTRAALLAELRRRIDPAFLPRPLVLLERLPRAASGKLPRAALQALARTHGVRGGA